MPTSLDIVLPCYNPRSDWAGRVVESFSKIKAALATTSINLIIVNDGSQKNVSDESLNEIRAAIPGFKFISYNNNMGKGYALRKGVAVSDAEFCIFTDIDFPYLEDSLVNVFRALNEDKKDIVIGVRGTSYYEHAPAFRRMISRFLRWLIRNLLHIPVTDTQGGLKGFDGRGKEVFLKTTINRYLFDLQFIYLAAKRKDLKMVPLEVQLKTDVIFSRMNMRILIGEAFNFIKILFSK